MQASAQHPELGRPHVRRRSPTLGKATPGTATSTCSPTPATAYESVLVVGRLFTDEHMAEMISHPLFCLGVDTFTVRTRGPARGRPAPPARLRRARPLPHPPRAGERHAPPRGGDPEDDEHAGRALRPLGPGLLRAGYAPTSSSSTTTTLDEVSTIEDPHDYARGVEHVLVNGAVVVDGGEHTGARPGRHLLRRLTPT